MAKQRVDMEKLRQESIARWATANRKALHEAVKNTPVNQAPASAAGASGTGSGGVLEAAAVIELTYVAKTGDTIELEIYTAVTGIASMTVDWGDGNTSTVNDNTDQYSLSTNHVYTDSGVYNVKLAITHIELINYLAFDGISGITGLDKLTAELITLSFNNCVGINDMTELGTLPATCDALSFSNCGFTSISGTVFPDSVEFLDINNCSALTSFTAALPANILELRINSNLNLATIDPAGIDKFPESFYSCTIISNPILTGFPLSRLNEGFHDMTVLSCAGFTGACFTGAQFPSTMTFLSMSLVTLGTIAPVDLNFDRLSLNSVGLTGFDANLLGSNNRQMDFASNHIPVTDVNAMLTRLDAVGKTTGSRYFRTSGQTPSAPPSGAGATAKTSLQSKGWTVLTD